MDDNNNNEKNTQGARSPLLLIILWLFAVLFTATFILWASTHLLGLESYVTLPNWVTSVSWSGWQFLIGGSTGAGLLIWLLYKLHIQKPVMFALSILVSALLLVVTILGVAWLIQEVRPGKPDQPPDPQPEKIPQQTETPPRDTDLTRLISRKVDAMSDADLLNFFGQIFIVGTDSREFSAGLGSPVSRPAASAKSR